MAEKIYPVPAEQFDGAKFKTRYSLTQKQFYAKSINNLNHVVLRDGVNLPDDPPIFDPPDPPQNVRRARAAANVQAVTDSGVTIRAVALTLLDLINNTRQQMTPPLSQISRQQFATFLQQKLDSGAVDT